MPYGKCFPQWHLLEAFHMHKYMPCVGKLVATYISHILFLSTFVCAFVGMALTFGFYGLFVATMACCLLLGLCIVHILQCIGVI